MARLPQQNLSGVMFCKESHTGDSQMKSTIAMGVKGATVVFVKRYFAYFWLSASEIHGVFILKFVKKSGFTKHSNKLICFQRLFFI